MTPTKLVCATVGSIAGVLLGLFAMAGCGNGDYDCNCPHPKAISLGTFKVRDIERSGATPTLTNASVQIAQDSIVVEYAREGANVAVRYRKVQ
jgi:hypothetical protein